MNHTMAEAESTYQFGVSHADHDEEYEDYDSRSSAAEESSAEMSSFIQLDEEAERLIHEDDDPVGNIEDIKRVLSLLDQKAHLPENEKEWVQEVKGNIDGDAFQEWNEHQQHEYSDSETERVKIHDNRRFEIVTKNRNKCVNFLLTLLFHLVVVGNFIFCVYQSFNIIMEDAKFSVLLLDYTLNCLEVIPCHDAIAHFVNIFDAFSCVVVLHANTSKTATLCWVFIIASTLHTCFEVYTLLFMLRFPQKHMGQAKSHIVNHTIKQVGTFLAVVLGQLISTLVLIQRYYDLTGEGHIRARKFITQTHEGKQLNDRIVYRNESKFLQRKFVLRSCTALQIYNTVNKLQRAKAKLKKGEELDDTTFQKEVGHAVQVLKGMMKIFILIVCCKWKSFKIHLVLQKYNISKECKC